MAGGSLSGDGDVTGNHGGFDYWIVKLYPDTVSNYINNINNTTSISIFPNPTTGIISVKGANNITIKIYNIIGQLMIEENNKQNISIAEMPAGLYLVKVFNTQGILLKQDKIIKE